MLPESDSDKANQLRDDFANLVHELLAPDVFPVEVAHALTRAERRSILPHSKAPDLYDDLLSTMPDLFPSLSLMPRAIELSSQFRIGVYDCLYRALPEQEDCELLTADIRLSKTFPRFVLFNDL